MESENGEMNLHPEAINFRNDLQKVLSSFKEIKLCTIVDRLVDYLKAQGQEIEFITIYEYVTKKALPAWILPHLFDFLSQEPYVVHDEVLDFLCKYGGPVERAVCAAKVAARQKMHAIALASKKYEKYLE